MKNHIELLLATPSVCQSRDLMIHVLFSVINNPFFSSLHFMFLFIYHRYDDIIISSFIINTM